jgi:predicted dienelactone hydrolase
MTWPSSTLAAERVYVTYNVLERSIPVASLETYARTGVIDDDLAVYAQYADASTMRQFREALVAKAELSTVAVAQFLYSPQGEILLRRLGQVIQPESRITGFSAIRAALITASADQEGLTLLNVLRRFPTRGLRIDVERSLDVVKSLEEVIGETNNATRVIAAQADLERSTSVSVPSQVGDLRQPGLFGIKKQTIVLTDVNRQGLATPTGRSTPSANGSKGRVYEVDIYLPEARRGATDAAIPVVVISHGVGSDRTTFSYLAEHLASHGFAVLVPEHPGSNRKQMESLIKGTANEAAEPTEFVDRPLDVTYLLDYLENNPPSRQRLNFKQVGVVGQSFGGYTALALVGAPINFKTLEAGCKDLEQTLNLSLLLQCRADQLQLPNRETITLQDPRIKAAIAINPISSVVFGQESLQQIQVPTMIVTGNADTVAPALIEQIHPFTWLTTSDRYLVLMDRGTHFSAIAGTEALDSPSQEPLPIPPELIGPNPAIARRYIRSLSLAFFQAHINDRLPYRNYLTAAYANNLSESALPLSLTEALTADQLKAKK